MHADGLGQDWNILYLVRVFTPGPLSTQDFQRRSGPLSNRDFRRIKRY